MGNGTGFAQTALIMFLTASVSAATPGTAAAAGAAGTASKDASTVEAFGVDVYGADVYVVGQSQDPEFNRYAMAARYDSSGVLAWVSVFGSGQDDVVKSVDVTSGAIYVAGSTLGAMPSSTSMGQRDAFVARLDLSGQVVWLHQFGTAGNDYAAAVTMEGNRVLVAGQTCGTSTELVSTTMCDASVGAYSVRGREIWSDRFGSQGDDSLTGVSAYGGNVYVAGQAREALPGETYQGGVIDAFVRKYSMSGEAIWTRQFGTTGNDFAAGLVAGPAGVFVAGGTTGALPGQAALGGYDGFVRAYSYRGSEQWTRQFGSSQADIVKGIASGFIGKWFWVYVAGVTMGSFPGQTNSGGYDLFLQSLDSRGADPRAQQLPTMPGSSVNAASAMRDTAYVAARVPMVQTLDDARAAPSFDGMLIKLTR